MAAGRSWTPQVMHVPTAEEAKVIDAEHLGRVRRGHLQPVAEAA